MSLLPPERPASLPPNQDTCHGMVTGGNPVSLCWMSLITSLMKHGTAIGKGEKRGGGTDKVRR